MHIDWKCKKCGQYHTSLIENLMVKNNESFNLSCSTCSTISTFKILSLKYSANCAVSNDQNNAIDEQLIIIY